MHCYEERQVICSLLQVARYTSKFLRETRLEQSQEEGTMTFSDQTLYCRDCNSPFTFSAGEQEFFAQRGLNNPPSRCPSCRAARKAQMSGGGYSNSRNSGSREPRQMYSATCSSCGGEALVPFQPRGDRPVYCSDCYQAQGVSRSSGNRSRSRW